MSTTIAAISTPRAVGGISVIRISGEDALAVADRVFKPLSSGTIPSQMKGYTCAYGVFVAEDGEKIDDGILTVFRCPHSYTGEDVVEISCHGGIFVTDMLLHRVFECGVSPASSGEFTKRAFLNGKMSLTQAEAVMDIISAQGKAFTRSSEEIKSGRLYKQIDEYSSKLLTILGAVSAWIDYPEEDIDEITPESMREDLVNISNGLNAIVNTYDSGKILRDGVKSIIIGKPNAGKSTLMNLLCGCERSIVTAKAGTTRDVIEESVRLGDILLCLSDTAGIRSTSDEIEEAGINIALKQMERAELIIAVFDSSCMLDSDDIAIIERCSKLAENRVKTIACINKNDLETVCDIDKIKSSFENVVEISAINSDSITEIQKVLYKLFITDSINENQIIISNERQKQCLDRAKLRVDEAINALDMGITLDAVNIVLDEAQGALLELNGQRVTDEVVNEVFSHFCVGK